MFPSFLKWVMCLRLIYKRIISGVLVFVTLFFACIPVAFASGTGSLDTPLRGDFWSWLQVKDNAFKSIFDKDICPKSPNTNGRHEFVQTATTVDGKDGLFYVCRYCGDSADIVGKKVHQQQVDSLPASGYTSSGNLIWQVSSANLSSYSILAYYPGSGRTLDFVSSDNLSLNDKDNGFHGSSSSGDRVGWVYPDVKISNFPVSGSYRVIESPALSGRAVSSGKIITVTAYYSVGTWFHFNPTSTFSVYSSHSEDFPSSWTYFSFECYFPVFEVIPDEAIDTTLTGQYGINSRPTAITGGNYGIVGDNGQITTINNNQQIINETNNTYYNPATGQTVPILNWTYDYGDRIYTLELEGSVTVDVRYGDENITITENTINEGDTTVNNYTIYYIIDGGSGETPGPSPSPGPETTPCPHAWAETSRTDPSCTAPGSASFSCSKCGETKTDKLPATGHTWQILRTVQTTYDEEGNLVQQGYTIYQCAVCSEQYKDDQGTGPPGGGQEEDKETIWDKIASFFGSIVDGIAGILEAILGKLLDALTALSELLMGKVKDVVEVVLSVLDELPKLFSGFLDFLALIFPFLPAEITLLLTFGVIAVVFTGIIKALRR